MTTKSQIDPAALLLAVIAVGLALALLPGSFGWLSTISGVILLLVLFSYDQQGYRSAWQSLAFSAVCGFSFMLAAAYVLQFFNGRAGLDALLPLTWAVATIVVVFVDRTRVSGRQAPLPEPAHEQTAVSDAQFATRSSGSATAFSTFGAIASQPQPPMLHRKPRTYRARRRRDFLSAIGKSRTPES